MLLHNNKRRPTIIIHSQQFSWSLVLLPLQLFTTIVVIAGKVLLLLLHLETSTTTYVICQQKCSEFELLLLWLLFFGCQHSSFFIAEATCGKCPKQIQFFSHSKCALSKLRACARRLGSIRHRAAKSHAVDELILFRHCSSLATERIISLLATILILPKYYYYNNHQIISSTILVTHRKAIQLPCRFSSKH